MLKFKDNVDLNKLGFTEYDVSWFNRENYIQVDKDTNQIRIIDFSLNSLFDYIKQDLVEKIEDETKKI